MEDNVMLIVDDMEVNRDILSQLFEGTYNIVQAGDGEEAIEYIRGNSENIKIILLDIIMPKVDGFGVLNELHERGMMKRIPVILITGDDSQDTEQRGYDMGVSDIVTKPFNPYIVRKRVSNVASLYRHQNYLEDLIRKQTDEIEKQAKKIKEINNHVIDTLSTVVEFRDLESGQHIMRIRYFTRILLECIAENYKEYGIQPSDIEMISVASVLHDIGKIAIPDTILLKPGRLTGEEFEIMKSHSAKGGDIVKRLNFIDEEEFYKRCYEICRHHHERYDGKGYPDGLVGDDIPICAQIVALADVYDALVSERVYKDAYSKEEAHEMIVGGQCGVFSDKILDCFKRARSQFEYLVDHPVELV